MELKPGYKQTEVGVIPEDWDVKRLGEVARFRTGPFGSALHKEDYIDNGIPIVNPMHIVDAAIVPIHEMTITAQRATELADFRLRQGDIIIGRRGEMGRCAVVAADQDGWLCGTGSMIVRANQGYSAEFLQLVLSSKPVIASIENASVGSTMINLNQGVLNDLKVALPSNTEEQQAIATSIKAVGSKAEALQALITKKRQLKQAAMQELLTGKRRLPGFEGEWEMKTIEESADCLDSVRVPLNEAQREQIPGDYPYCGANGVLGFVSDFVIDDDIILMAEDGGYFDEYKTRPIAYRMKGRCWVNNHAHILKAKPGFDQGFLFYSLVHKNILPFLASGTRAKLNKSEMNKISVRLPCDVVEQGAIASVLSELDAELEALEARKDKAQQLKQGMMQQLLTGKIRLK